MKNSKVTIFVFCAAAALSLAGCGGGDSGTVGGTLTGLNSGASVVLQDDNTDNLTLTESGSFTFATDIATNGTYDVTVLTQPVGQTCSVANGVGTIDTNDDPVTDVSVTCTTTSSVGGTLVGLAPGTSVTLSNDGVTLPIAVNGAFAFPGVLAAGTSYDVVVTTQPAGQTCTVTNASGAVAVNVMASVSVACN